MTEDASGGTPQFTKAEYSEKSADLSCKACAQKISGDYYRVNGVPVCSECTRRLQQQMPQDSHQAFMRALLFGVGAALAGFVLYVVFALSTGLVIGFVSLAVGYLVGKAISLGSRGVGGRRYQITAVVLTYMAVSLAAVPIAISVSMKQKSAQQHAQASEPAAQPAAAPAAAAESPPAAAPPAPQAPARAARPSFARIIGMLTLLGLASPFLDLAGDPMHGIIGLIILLVGIRIAWQLTAAKTLEISGPIAGGAAAPAGSA